MINDLAPGFSKIRYAAMGMTHQMIVPIRAFDGAPVPGTEPQVMRWNNSPAGWVSMNVALVDQLADFFDVTTVFGLCEVWSKAVGQDPVFVYATESGNLGDNVGDNVEDAMVTLTYRTSLGGNGKFQLMEGVFNPNFRSAWATGDAAPYGGFLSYVLGDSHPWAGRDGGRPVAGINKTTKTSDALRRKRLLNV